MNPTAILLQQHEQLLAATRQEAQLTAAAYGLALAAPLETPSREFVEARSAAERQFGVRFVKYFMPKGN